MYVSGAGLKLVPFAHGVQLVNSAMFHRLYLHLCILKPHDFNQFARVLLYGEINLLLSYIIQVREDSMSGNVTLH